MPNFSGIWSAAQQFQARGQNIWPKAPGAPTIGTATAGNSLCASVTFTAPACTGYPAGVTGYRVTSTPGCITNTGASSPIVVSGLTNGTSYTFKVSATNATGYGSCSAASNSITASNAGSQSYTSAGTYSWVAPAGVTSVSVVAIGGGGGGAGSNAGTGGAGGGLGYINNYAVTPSSSYTVVVGSGGSAGYLLCFNPCAGSPSIGLPTSGGDSYFVNTSTVKGGGGQGSAKSFPSCGTTGGTYTGTGGGNGGQGFGTNCGTRAGGGGGAGGYSGTGGNGGMWQSSGTNATAGTGGAGGGGGWRDTRAFVGGTQAAGGGAGGGVGILGSGSNGAAGTGTTGGCVNTAAGGGGGGSGGNNGGGGVKGFGGAGGAYGGGGGGYGYCYSSSTTYTQNFGGAGQRGAVRIIWPGNTRSFPSTCAGNP